MKRFSLLLALGALLIPALFVGSVHAASSPEVFSTSLNGSAERPGVIAVGTGDAQIIINAAGTDITYRVNYVNLTGPVVAAHIHFGALDVSGPVMLPFTVGTNPLVGHITASTFLSTPQAPKFADALNAIRTGKAYVNLHTAAHPGGEVRGQLYKARNLQWFGGTLKGANESPAVSTAGTGTAQVLVETSGAALYVFVDYSGLSGDVVASHIHVGAPGANGPVSIPFKVTASPIVQTLSSSNFVTTTAAPKFADTIAAIRSGNAYVNVHTAAHPGGEVRANLAP